MGTNDPEVKAPSGEGATEQEVGDRAGLPIHDARGMVRYLTRPPFFADMDPNSLDQYFSRKFELRDAELSGVLPVKLAELGLSGKEMWWWIEASFYQRHFGPLGREQGAIAYAGHLARAWRDYEQVSLDRARQAGGKLNAT